MGGTRGRIYIKHADLFKVLWISVFTVGYIASALFKKKKLSVCVFQYAADAQDKQWLAEKQHMRATGGKMVSLCVHNVCKG